MAKTIKEANEEIEKLKKVIQTNNRMVRIDSVVEFLKKNMKEYTADDGRGYFNYLWAIRRGGEYGYRSIDHMIETIIKIDDNEG